MFTHIVLYALYNTHTHFLQLFVMLSFVNDDISDVICVSSVYQSHRQRSHQSHPVLGTLSYLVKSSSNYITNQYGYFTNIIPEHKHPHPLIHSCYIKQNEKQALKEAEDEAFRRKMDKVLEYMESNPLFNATTGRAGMEEEKMDPIPQATTESIPYTLKSPKIDAIKFSKSFS